MNVMMIVLGVLLILQSGCAAGARVGGQERGIGVGAAVGTPAQPPAYQQPVPPAPPF